MKLPCLFGNHWEHRPLRQLPASRSQGTIIELEDRTEPDTEGQTDINEDSSAQDSFAVFDVHLHSRVLQCPRSLSIGQRILPAVEQTPQTSAERFDYRFVRFALPGLPCSSS